MGVGVLGKVWIVTSTHCSNMLRCNACADSGFERS